MVVHITDQFCETLGDIIHMLQTHDANGLSGSSWDGTYLIAGRTKSRQVTQETATQSANCYANHVPFVQEYEFNPLNGESTLLNQISFFNNVWVNDQVLYPEKVSFLKYVSTDLITQYPGSEIGIAVDYAYLINNTFGGTMYMFVDKVTSAFNAAAFVPSDPYYLMIDQELSSFSPYYSLLGFQFCNSFYKNQGDYDAYQFVSKGSASNVEVIVRKSAKSGLGKLYRGCTAFRNTQSYQILVKAYHLWDDTTKILVPQVTFSDYLNSNSEEYKINIPDQAKNPHWSPTKITKSYFDETVPVSNQVYYLIGEPYTFDGKDFRQLKDDNKGRAALWRYQNTTQPSGCSKMQVFIVEFDHNHAYNSDSQFFAKVVDVVWTPFKLTVIMLVTDNKAEIGQVNDKTHFIGSAELEFDMKCYDSANYILPSGDPLNPSFVSSIPLPSFSNPLQNRDNVCCQGSGPSRKFRGYGLSCLNKVNNMIYCQVSGVSTSPALLDPDIIYIAHANYYTQQTFDSTKKYEGVYMGMYYLGLNGVNQKLYITNLTSVSLMVATSRKESTEGYYDQTWAHTYLGTVIQLARFSFQFVDTSSVQLVGTISYLSSAGTQTDFNIISHDFSTVTTAMTGMNMTNAIQWPSQFENTLVITDGIVVTFPNNSVWPASIVNSTNYVATYYFIATYKGLNYYGVPNLATGLTKFNIPFMQSDLLSSRLSQIDVTVKPVVGVSKLIGRFCISGGGSWVQPDISTCLQSNSANTMHQVHTYDNVTHYMLYGNPAIKLTVTGLQTKQCSITDSFSLTTTHLNVMSEILDLPYNISQSQLVNNPNWNDQWQQIFAYQLNPDKSFYRNVPFVGGLFQLSNSDSDINKKRINETQYLIVFHKNCAFTQQTWVPSIDDILQSANRLEAYEIQLNLTFLNCKSENFTAFKPMLEFILQVNDVERIGSTTLVENVTSLFSPERKEPLCIIQSWYVSQTDLKTPVAPNSVLAIQTLYDGSPGFFDAVRFRGNQFGDFTFLVQLELGPLKTVHSFSQQIKVIVGCFRVTDFKININKEYKGMHFVFREIHGTKIYLESPFPYLQIDGYIDLNELVTFQTNYPECGAEIITAYQDFGQKIKANVSSEKHPTFLTPFPALRTADGSKPYVAYSFNKYSPQVWETFFMAETNGTLGSKYRFIERFSLVFWFDANFTLPPLEPQWIGGEMAQELTITAKFNLNYTLINTADNPQPNQYVYRSPQLVSLRDLTVLVSFQGFVDEVQAVWNKLESIIEIRVNRTQITETKTIFCSLSYGVPNKPNMKQVAIKVNLVCDWEGDVCLYGKVISQGNLIFDYNDKTNITIQRIATYFSVTNKKYQIDLYSLDNSQEKPSLSEVVSYIRLEKGDVLIDFKGLYMLDYKVIKFDIVAKCIPLKSTARLWVLLKQQPKPVVQSAKSLVMKQIQSLRLEVSQFNPFQKIFQNKTHELTSRISKIDLSGIMNIEFSKPMKDEENGFNVSWINSSVLNITFDLSNETISFGAQNRLEENELKALTWKPISFMGQNLKIKLLLNKPLYIAYDGHKDFLLVEVLRRDLFINKEGQQGLTTEFMSKLMKRMLSNTEGSRNLKDNQQLYKFVLYGTTFANWMLNICLSKGSKGMERTLNFLQLMVFQTLINVQFPANIQIMNDVIYTLINAEIFQPEYSSELIFDFQQDKEYVEAAFDQDYDQFLKRSYYEAGFESYNPVLNLGGIYIIFLFLCFRFVFAVFIKSAINFTHMTLSTKLIKRIQRPNDLAKEGGFSSSSSFNEAEEKQNIELKDEVQEKLSADAEEVDQTQQQSSSSSSYSESLEETKEDQPSCPTGFYQKNMRLQQPKRRHQWTELGQVFEENSSKEEDSIEFMQLNKMKVKMLGNRYKRKTKSYAKTVYRNSKNPRSWEQLADSILNGVLFKEPIMLVRESFFQVLIACLLFLNMPVDLNSEMKKILPSQQHHNYLLAHALQLVTLCIFPLIGLLIFIAKEERLTKPSRFGVFWAELQIRESASRCYIFFWSIRRICTVVLSMFYEQSGVQIMLLGLMNLFALEYVGIVRPFRNRELNRQEIIQDFVILCLASQLSIFTDYCFDPEYRYNFGWFYITELIVFVLLSLNITFNKYMFLYFEFFSKKVYPTVQKKWEDYLESRRKQKELNYVEYVDELPEIDVLDLEPSPQLQDVQEVQPEAKILQPDDAELVIVDEQNGEREKAQKLTAEVLNSTKNLIDMIQKDQSTLFNLMNKSQDSPQIRKFMIIMADSDFEKRMKHPIKSVQLKAELLSIVGKPEFKKEFEDLTRKYPMFKNIRNVVNSEELKGELLKKQEVKILLKKPSHPQDLKIIEEEGFKEKGLQDLLSFVCDETVQGPLNQIITQLKDFKPSENETAESKVAAILDQHSLIEHFQSIGANAPKITNILEFLSSPNCDSTLLKLSKKVPLLVDLHLVITQNTDLKLALNHLKASEQLHIDQAARVLNENWEQLQQDISKYQHTLFSSLQSAHLEYRNRQLFMCRKVFIDFIRVNNQQMSLKLLQTFFFRKLEQMRHSKILYESEKCKLIYELQAVTFFIMQWELETKSKTIFKQSQKTKSFEVWFKKYVNKEFREISFDVQNLAIVQNWKYAQDYVIDFKYLETDKSVKLDENIRHVIQDISPLWFYKLEYTSTEIEAFTQSTCTLTADEIPNIWQEISKTSKNPELMWKPAKIEQIFKTKWSNLRLTMIKEELRQKMIDEVYCKHSDKKQKYIQKAMLKQLFKIMNHKVESFTAQQKPSTKRNVEVNIFDYVWEKVVSQDLNDFILSPQN